MGDEIGSDHRFEESRFRDLDAPTPSDPPEVSDQFRRSDDESAGDSEILEQVGRNPASIEFAKVVVPKLVRSGNLPFSFPVPTEKLSLPAMLDLVDMGEKFSQLSCVGTLKSHPAEAKESNPASLVGNFEFHQWSGPGYLSEAMVFRHHRPKLLFLTVFPASGRAASQLRRFILGDHDDAGLAFGRRSGEAPLPEIPGKGRLARPSDPLRLRSSYPG